MQTKERYTPETIIVYPIDMKKLNKNVDEFFHKDNKFPATITYSTSGTLALIRIPKPCIIDDEFVGHDVGEKITFYIHECEEMTNGRKRHTCFPTQEVTLTLKELEVYLKSETMLAEFTKERRGYNSRIRANEGDWVRYFNK